MVSVVYYHVIAFFQQKNGNCRIYQTKYHCRGHLKSSPPLRLSGPIIISNLSDASTEDHFCSFISSDGGTCPVFSHTPLGTLQQYSPSMLCSLIMYAILFEV
jgi:hypothetical protein